MGNASFIVPSAGTSDDTSRGAAGPRQQSPPQARQEAQQSPLPPKFAELTGAYWLEPIFTGLAQEWSSQGRSVPGAQKDPWQNMADARGAPEAPREPEQDRAEDDSGSGSGSGSEADGDGGRESRGRADTAGEVPGSAEAASADAGGGDRG